MSEPNSLNKLWAEGGSAVNAWLAINSPVSAEMMAKAGWDTVTIDTQHGMIDLGQAMTMIQTVSGAGAIPLVRVPWNDPVYIKRALDIGVMGIMVPYVQNAEEARAAVSACRYPPRGIRGVAPHAGRCSRWGARLDEYRKAWPKQLLLMCQIETEEAVKNIDEIAAVDGVDMLFLGPSDISASAGHMLDMVHPEVNALMERAERNLRRTNKLLGTVIRPGQTLNWTYERGYDFIVAGNDARLLGAAAQAQVGGFHDKPPKRPKRSNAPHRNRR